MGLCGLPVEGLIIPFGAEGQSLLASSALLAP